MPSVWRPTGMTIAAVAAVAAAACGPASTPGATDTTSPSPPAPAAPTSPSPQDPASPSPAAASPTAVASPSPAPPPDDARSITVRVAEGRVEGVERRVEVPLGTTVRLEVSADVADEVHVHGYDLFADVTPDAPASLEFVADIPGAFEVELEQAGLVLFELRVIP